MASLDRLLFYRLHKKTGLSYEEIKYRLNHVADRFPLVGYHIIPIYQLTNVVYIQIGNEENVCYQLRWSLLTTLYDRTLNASYIGEMWSNISYVLNFKLKKYCKIRINHIWAEHMLREYDNDDMWNALVITIGHEAGHWDGDIEIKATTRKEKRFLSWVREVRNDFFGAALFGGSSIDNLVKSCRYKHDFKIQETGKDPGSSYPSWEQREIYARTGKFNRELLYLIAEHLKIQITENVEKMINEILLFYGEIQLS